MIYLIKNLSTTYNLIVTSLADIPVTGTYNINNGTYNINDTVFANIMYVPNTFGLNSIEARQNLLAIVDDRYNSNQYELLVQNRNKFIIALVKYLPNRFKDTEYVNFYTNLLDSSMQLNEEYKKLLKNNSHHHYAILNYHTNKIEEYITKEDAIEKLNRYVNEFIIEYKPNIVKEFFSKEELLEYITLEKVNL
jgi:hypothetical protein